MAFEGTLHTTDGQTTKRTLRATIRTGTGIAAAVLLVLIGMMTMANAGGETVAGADLSAVQLAQVYAEGCFYAIVVTGIAIGVYIASRTD